MKENSPYVIYLSENPHNFRLWEQHSQWVFHNDDTPSVMNGVLDQFQSYFSDEIHLHLWVSQLYSDTKQYDRSIETMCLIGVDQRCSLWKLNFSIYLSLSGNIDHAAEVINHIPPRFIAESIVDNPIITASIIRILHIGNHTQTLKELVKSLPLRQQRNPYIQGVLSLFHYDQDQIHLARSRAILSLNAQFEPETPKEAFMTLGLLCMKENDIEMAIHYFDQILSRYPNESRSCYSIALCYIHKGSMDVALHYLSKAVDHCPRPHIGIFLMYAFLLILSEELEVSGNILNKIERINPTFSELYAARAMHAAVSNNRSIVPKLMMKAKKLNPNSPLVEKTHQWLKQIL